MKLTSVALAALIGIASLNSAASAEKRVKFTAIPKSLVGKTVSIVSTFKGKGVHVLTVYCSGRCGGSGGGSGNAAMGRAVV